MKQLLVLSGKGGTGKTTLVSSFIALSNARAFADCDVDAPNLHLVMKGFGEPKTEVYYGMDKAMIDQAMCTDCGECHEVCRFGAIDYDASNNVYQVNPYACEGCSVCETKCPAEAITMISAADGKTYVYKEQSIFSTATLKMGSGTSGKLVSKVKKNLEIAIEDEALDIAILDGSPGIGCPVIASISGVDMLLIVAEPTISGMSDLMRIVEVGQHFQVPIAICVNKYDVNKKLSLQIERYCQDNALHFVGYIPYDEVIANIGSDIKKLVNSEKPIARAIGKTYKNTMNVLEKELR